MSLRPKRWLARLESSPHGGIDYAELKAMGLDPEPLLDFSVSTNPFMPPPGIKEMMASLPVERYPDSSSGELRQKLAERLGLS